MPAASRRLINEDAHDRLVGSYSSLTKLRNKLFS
jgi:hypothetical protein